METIDLASPIATSAQLACALTTAWSASSSLLQQVGLASAPVTVVVLASPIELEDIAA